MEQYIFRQSHIILATTPDWVSSKFLSATDQLNVTCLLYIKAVFGQTIKA